MHTDSPVIKKKSPLFNCESGPAGSRPRFRRGIVPTMTTHSGNGSAPGSRVSVWISFFCFAESRSFASQQKFIPGGDGESCADRQMSLRRRTHAREPGPVTFPNTSRPTTNNSCSSHLSHGDGSRYGALCHRHTFYLVFGLGRKM